ncbi:NAD-dependent epimerase/dehydratase family protein, partial [Gammaproteobacteria bacterium]|nr:NAD-dependent epimerase/dehydratase family protein [Gammaproteobacteria bacterium]
MHVLITGSKGFIGKNLVVELSSIETYSFDTFDRGDSFEMLESKIRQADAVIHLAGENRPSNSEDFEIGNHQLTKLICEAIERLEKKIPIIFSSSTQAEDGNLYGDSKLAAENALHTLEEKTGCPVSIYRLPGVFGKWSRPNYNSVVATFCYNIANKLPIQVNNPEKSLPLVYIDDVIKSFINTLQSSEPRQQWISVEPTYTITLQALADQLKLFYDSRGSL